MKQFSIPALLSFNGGFVDTIGFLGLQGLFTAHVTGNFVTLAATLVSGTHGVIAKLLALPEFIVVIAVARLAGAAMTARGMPALRLLLGRKSAVSSRLLRTCRYARTVSRQRRAHGAR